MTETRMGFAFNAEDRRLLNIIKEELAKTQGPVSNIAALRVAIRTTANRISLNRSREEAQ